MLRRLGQVNNLYFLYLLSTCLTFVYQDFKFVDFCFQGLDGERSSYPDHVVHLQSTPVQQKVREFVDVTA